MPRDGWSSADVRKYDELVLTALDMKYRASRMTEEAESLMVEANKIVDKNKATAATE